MFTGRGSSVPPDWTEAHPPHCLTCCKPQFFPPWYCRHRGPGGSVSEDCPVPWGCLGASPSLPTDARSSPSPSCDGARCPLGEKAILVGQEPCSSQQHEFMKLPRINKHSHGAPVGRCPAPSVSGCDGRSWQRSRPQAGEPLGWMASLCASGGDALIRGSPGVRWWLFCSPQLTY